MTVAIAHVFAEPAQCQAHHGECHNNVDGPKQRRSLEGRLYRNYLFVDGIHALPRLPSPDRRTRNSFDNNYGFFIGGESRAIAIPFPYGSVFSEKMRLLPFSLLIANGPVWRHGQ